MLFVVQGLRCAVLIEDFNFSYKRGKSISSLVRIFKCDIKMVYNYVISLQNKKRDTGTHAHRCGSKNNEVHWMNFIYQASALRILRDD